MTSIYLLHLLQQGIPDNLDNKALIVIGGGGFVSVSDHGSVGYHGIPSNVSEYLNKQHLQNIKFIAIGPDSQYFISKTNGKCQYRGSSSFETAIDENYSTKGIEYVSFGAVYGDWFMRYGDGSTEWSIHNICGTLASILRNSRSIQCVYIGRNGSYFFSYDDDKKSYSNLPAGVMKHVSNGSKSVKQVLIDEKNDEFFVRYSYK